MEDSLGHPSVALLDALLERVDARVEIVMHVHHAPWCGAESPTPPFLCALALCATDESQVGLCSGGSGGIIGGGRE